MEFEIGIDELNNIFHNVINSADDLNNTILSTLYKSINNFFVWAKKEDSQDKFYDLLKDYENEAYIEAYITKGKKLSDVQIIEYEFSRIMKEYNKQKKEYIIDGSGRENYRLNSEIKQQALVLVEHYIQQLKIFKEIEQLTDSDIDFIKKQIAYIEILLEIKNGLYYQNFLLYVSELDRIEKITNLNRKKIWRDRI